MKTIKELEYSLKVSKVSIYKAIKKDGIKEHVFKQDNTTLIDEMGEKRLFELFHKGKSDNSDIDSEGVLTNNNINNKESIQDEKVDLLRELLQEKDSQIQLLLSQLTEKDNQINTLQRLLENQQKLQIPMITDGKIIDEQSAEGENKKLGFWRFWKK